MIKHTPCITDDEVIWRLIEDQREIDIMVREGHQVIAKVSYQSPSTFECHCLPVFKNDKLTDIVNRYYDFFPKDFKKCLKDMEDHNKNLSSNTGMSQMGNMMSFGSIPVGLQKMLDIWAGGDFLARPSMRKNLRNLFNYVPKLKAGAPYGQKFFAT